MIIFFSILLVLVIAGLKKNSADYMSIKMTNSIKGIFLCMVFFSHICTYMDFSHPLFDMPYQVIRRFTGQCIVTMFLFYSGYGIMEAIKKKGGRYVKSIPTQRFIKVLLQFDCAIVPFLIYRYLTGNHYDIKKIVLTLIAYDGIGNSNWYIFCILCLYAFTFVAFTVFRDSYKKAIISILIWSIIYMLIMCKLKEQWWYDTTLCYTYGMLFSLYRSKIEKIVNMDANSWLFSFLTFVIGYTVFYFYKNSNSAAYQMWIFCFVAAIVTFTMRYVINSKPLQWLGENLFELYILQRLPMMILKNHIAIPNYVYVILSFIITVMLAVIYKKTINKLISKMLKKLS